MASFLDAWLHHWGWLWMIIGFLGYLIVVSLAD